MQELTKYISSKINVDCQIRPGYNTIECIGNISNLEEHLKFLHDDAKCRFELFVDVFAIDYPDKEKRFEVVYLLLSIVHNTRICYKISISEHESPSTITKIYHAAGWFEREIFDMYGITFKDHPDLRRILTDYTFKGHPMLKDFPLTGYEEVRYDLVSKKVVYNPVDLQQEFRNFDYLSPWKGTDYKE